jgi:probable phosphoglycerate mutase
MTDANYRHSGLDMLRQLASRERLDLALDSFYFLRHGETEGNRQKFFQGADQPLNACGIGQAHAAAAILCNQPVSRIIASDMTRTLQTAGILGETLGLPICPSAALRERNFGAQVGTSSATIDWLATPPAGESLASFVERVRGGLQDALAHANALMVAHGGTLYVLSAVLGVTLDARRHTANASPLRFNRDGGDWTIEALDSRDEVEPNFS